MRAAERRRVYENHKTEIAWINKRDIVYVGDGEKRLKKKKKQREENENRFRALYTRDAGRESRAKIPAGNLTSRGWVFDKISNRDWT